MLRQLAKTGVAWTLAGLRADRLARSLTGTRGTPLVVGYHRVVEDFEEGARGALPGMIVSRRMLERHLDWLGRRFRIVPLDELGAALESGETSSPPLAAVTFDDGYADVYKHALPVLNRKGIPAAVFVVTECVASGTLPLYDRLFIVLSQALSRGGRAHHDVTRNILDLGLPLPHRLASEGLPAQPFPALRALLDALPQAGLMRLADALDPASAVNAGAFPELRSLTWAEVRALHEAGMTIGSHTRTHALLNREHRSRVQEEAAGSRAELERTLGVPVEHFAYPDGRFDDVALAAVKGAGYRYAYTTCAHRDPGHELLTIPRLMLWEASCLDAFGRFSSAVMACQTAGFFRPLARCTHSPIERRPVGTARPTSLAS